MWTLGPVPQGIDCWSEGGLGIRSAFKAGPTSHPRRFNVKLERCDHCVRLLSVCDLPQWCPLLEAWMSEVQGGTGFHVLTKPGRGSTIQVPVPLTDGENSLSAKLRTKRSWASSASRGQQAYGKWGLPMRLGPYSESQTQKDLRTHEPKFFIIETRKTRPREESLWISSHTNRIWSTKPRFSPPAHCVSDPGQGSGDPKTVKSLFHGETDFQANHSTERGMYDRMGLGMGHIVHSFTLGAHSFAYSSHRDLVHTRDQALY